MKVFLTTKTWNILMLISFVGKIYCLGRLSKNIRSFTSASNNEFAFDMLKTLPIGRHNQFFSPLSVSAAFVMISLGAKGNTLKEIKNTFHFNTLQATFADPMTVHKIYQNILKNYGNRNSDFTLEIANGIFIKQNYEIIPTFLQNTKEYYNATVDFTNFYSSEAERLINDWVARKTHEKIKKIFTSHLLSRKTVLALINAIYFKGKWKYEFNKHKTEDLPFHINKYTSKEVKMMKLIANFSYAEDDKLKIKAIRMPYVGEHLSMVVILPDLGNFQRLISNLNASVFQNLLNNMENKVVKLIFPRVNMDKSYELTSALKKLNLSSIFSRSADLSGMSKKPLQLSLVNHKAFLDVSEEGSEAAASTVLGFRPLSSFALRTIEVNVNRPFFFAIVDRRFNDVMLFSGTVICP